MGCARTHAAHRRVRALAQRPTILGQGLNLMARSHLEALAKVHGTGRPHRERSRWSQVGALVLAPLAGRHRLRDVASSLASQANALAPRGLRPPQRSTLAEANARRPVALSQALFVTRYARCRAGAPKQPFRFKPPLLSLDSTTIARCLRLCPWACFRTTTGAITVHTLWDHAGHVPAVVVLTEGPRSDRAVARGRQLPKGSLVAMARGSID
jgi:hypothetical protein